MARVKRDRYNDYPFIRHWGAMMGSRDYYIQDQVAQARHDKAPQTAIYKATDFDEKTKQFVKGDWHTIERVTNPFTRHWFTSRGLMTKDWTVPSVDGTDHD